MKTRYTVAEKAVMARDGEHYNLACYKEGADYVVRKCFSSFKHMFRSDILGVSVVDPSMVEHKQQPEAVNPQERQVVVKPQIPASEYNSAKLNQEQVINHQDVQECKIMKIHANFKWVDTDKGRVWVGLKGVHMRVNQVIRVKNGELFTGKTGPSGSLVRV